MFHVLKKAKKLS